MCYESANSRSVHINSECGCGFGIISTKGQIHISN